MDKLEKMQALFEATEKEIDLINKNCPYPYSARTRDRKVKEAKLLFYRYIKEILENRYL